MICKNLKECIDAQLSLVPHGKCGNKNSDVCIEISDKRSAVKCEENGKKYVYARAVVTSSTPNLKATPAYVNLEKMLRQTYNGNIKICERQFYEKDTDLDKR